MPLGWKRKAAHHQSSIEIEQQCTAYQDAIADLGSRYAGDLAPPTATSPGGRNSAAIPRSRQVSITGAAKLGNMRNAGRGARPNGTMM